MVTGTVGEPTEDEHGNLMWLVDFKLDFLSDIDKDDDANNNTEEPNRKKQKIDAPAPVREVRANDSLRPPTIRSPYYHLAGPSVHVSQMPHVPVHVSQVSVCWPRN